MNRFELKEVPQKNDVELSVVSNTELAFYLKASKTIRHILMHYNDECSDLSLSRINI